MVVDTSALMAMILGEPEAEACRAALGSAAGVAMSAATLAEALIVSAGRRRSAEMAEVLARLDPEVVPLTREAAERVGAAYARWGKGVHPARLNLGDCFAYALAQERRAPLLYVGDDFAQTDVASALPLADR